MTQHYLWMIGAPGQERALRRANEARAYAFRAAGRGIGRALAWPLRLGAEALARYRAARALARDEAALMEMSDHELADIGISRAEIAHAVRHGRGAVHRARGDEAEIVPFGLAARQRLSARDAQAVARRIA